MIGSGWTLQSDVTVLIDGSADLVDALPETIIVSGGRFSSMRGRICEHPGVIRAQTSHRAGISDGEVVQITFDPDQTSFRELFECVFVHGGTQNRRLRRNDVETKYRDATLTLNVRQRRLAEGAYVSAGPSAGLWCANVLW